MQTSQQKMTSHLYMTSFFEFLPKYSVDGDMTLHLVFPKSDKSAELHIQKYISQGSWIYLTLTMPLSRDIIDIIGDDENGVVKNENFDPRFSIPVHDIDLDDLSLQFLVTPVRVHKTRTTVDELMSLHRTSVDNLVKIDLRSATVTVVSKTKLKALATNGMDTMLSTTDSEFTRNPFKLVHVDEAKGHVILKPPVSNPFAVAKFTIVRTSNLSPSNIAGALQSWKGCGHECFVWAGGDDPTKRATGFIELVGKRDMPVGAKMLKRMGDDGFVPRGKRVRLQRHEGVEDFTEASLIKGPMVNFQTVSLDTRTFLTSMVAYPQFLKPSDLPPHIGVFRQESKFYNASQLSSGVACGTFYFRMPQTEMYLPIDTSKTVVYNDKVVALMDVLFKLGEEPRNAGVMRFWTFLDVLQRGNADAIDKGTTPSEGFGVMPLGKTLPISIEKRLLHVAKTGRLATTNPKLNCQTWWDVVIYIYMRFTVPTSLRSPLARFFYAQPPPATMFVFCKDGTWYTQRTTKLTKDMTSGWGASLGDLKGQLGAGVAVGVVTPPGPRFTDDQVSLFMWMAETTGKRPIMIGTKHFHNIVRYDCTTQETWEFLETHSRRLVDIPTNVGQLDTSMCEKYHPSGHVDMDLCYVFEALGIETVVCTSPFWPQETPFTEILDVRPRGDYEHLVWTGPQSRRQVFDLEAKVTKCLEDFRVKDAMKLMKGATHKVDIISRHGIGVDLQKTIIKDFYMSLLPTITNPEKLIALEQLKFPDGSAVVPPIPLKRLLFFNKPLLRKLLNMRAANGSYVIGMKQRLNLFVDASFDEDISTLLTWQREDNLPIVPFTLDMIATMTLAMVHLPDLKSLEYLLTLKNKDGSFMAYHSGQFLIKKSEFNPSVLKCLLAIRRDGKPLVNLHKEGYDLLTKAIFPAHSAFSALILLHQYDKDGTPTIKLSSDDIAHLIALVESTSLNENPDINADLKKQIIAALQAERRVLL